MTEHEWLTCENPARMLDWLTVLGPHGFVNRGLPRYWTPASRKLRLFACACGRLHAEPWFPDARSDPVMIAICDAERHADGQEPERFPLQSGDNQQGYYVLRNDAAEAARLMAGVSDDARKAALLRVIVGNPFRAHLLPGPTCGACQGQGYYDTVTGENEHDQCDCPDCTSFARCLQWQSGLIPSMAEQIYQERRFQELPALADALEDSGYTHADILNHLRGKERCWECDNGLCPPRQRGERADSIRTRWPCESCQATGWIALRGPHVLGDWALDIILGRN